MLKQITNVIIPDNIKEIQLVKDGLDIFLDYIIEHSNIAIDIKNVLDENKKELYEELVKVYLKNVYDVLKSSKHNERLYRKLKKLYKSLGLNIEDVDLSIDITEVLTRDFLISSRDYEESKGTPKAMKYIYDIVVKSGVQKDISNDSNASSYFKFFEGPNLFEYSVEGALIPEVYEQFVKPLTHPVGWAYFYKRVFYLGFTDYFRVNFNYTIRELSVKCMYGYSIDVDDYLNNVSHFKHYFDENPDYATEIENKKNELENKNSTLDPKSEEYKSNQRLINLYNKILNGDFTLVNDNTVEYIIDESIELQKDSIYRRTVYFASGEKLEVTKGISIVLYDIHNHPIIDYEKDFKTNCGLIADYDEELTTLVEDGIYFRLDESFASTAGKQNIVGAGNVFIGSTIVGEELVNKNISVTYQSKIGENDGTDVTNIYSLSGYDTTEKYQELRYDNIYGQRYYWDSGLHFDTGEFYFTALSGEIKEIIDKSYNNIKPKLYGYTARDDYSFVQVPIHQDLVQEEFKDNFDSLFYWDSGKNFDSNIHYDGNIIDEFDIKII